MKKFLISASILSANFAKLGEEVIDVISAGADSLHFDVMDNHYVPNLTAGPLVLRSLRDYGIKTPVDVHLMAKPIDRLILDFVSAGATCINFHLESTEHADRSIQLIKKNGCKVGVVLNPDITIHCLEYIAHQIDMIILMSVNPGFGGQLFLPIILNKIRQVRKFIDNNSYQINLAVDGGINTNNVSLVTGAGADVLIVGSAIFYSKNYRKNIKDLRSFC